VQEIAAKLADALSMFWQSLDDHERRLFALGVAWLLASIVMGAAERKRKQPWLRRRHLPSVAAAGWR